MLSSWSRISDADIRKLAANACAWSSTSFSPHVLAVQHEVAEFVCSVEAGPSTVVHIGAEDDDRVISER